MALVLDMPCAASAHLLHAMRPIVVGRAFLMYTSLRPSTRRHALEQLSSRIRAA